MKHGIKHAAMALTASLFSLVGCTQPHTPATHAGGEPLHHQPILVATSEPIENSTNWHGILSELFAAYEQTAPIAAEQPSMPQLVAGDWLAFQCATAGGYWDLPAQSDAPVFAGAPESWSALD
ncbi:MAG: hypothetical protein ACF8LL_01870 [Phycisphaerales bacterium]